MKTLYVLPVLALLLPIAASAAFVGEPKTTAQLRTCDVVVSKFSKKTYYKDKHASIIRGMAPKWALCKALPVVEAPKPVVKTQAQIQLELEAQNMALYGNPVGPGWKPVVNVTPEVLKEPVGVSATQQAPLYYNINPIQPVESKDLVTVEEKTTITVKQWVEPRSIEVHTPFTGTYTKGDLVPTLFVEASWNSDGKADVYCKNPNYPEYPNGIPLAIGGAKPFRTSQPMFGWKNGDANTCTITVDGVVKHATYTYIQ